MAGSPIPIQLSAGGIDLSPRVQRNATVVASPTDNTETIIASLTVLGNLAFGLGIVVVGFAAYTVGTNGTSVNLKLRKTDASGSTLKATGLVDIAATKLGSGMLIATDTTPTLPGQVYVLTMLVTAGSAASTVSAVELLALVV